MSNYFIGELGSGSFRDGEAGSLSCITTESAPNITNFSARVGDIRTTSNNRFQLTATVLTKMYKFDHLNMNITIGASYKIVSIWMISKLMANTT
jgi:hypothetical protein